MQTLLTYIKGKWSQWLIKFTIIAGLRYHYNKEKIIRKTWILILITLTVTNFNTNNQVQKLSPIFALSRAVLEQNGGVSKHHVHHDDQGARAKAAYVPDGDVGGAVLEVERKTEEAVPVVSGRVWVQLEVNKCLLYHTVLYGNILFLYIPVRKLGNDISINTTRF